MSTNKTKKHVSVMRAINPKTGCKAGSKGDIIGQVLLEIKTPAQIFESIQVRVAAFYAAAGIPATHAHVRRYAIVWIDTLRKQCPKIYARIQPGVCYSVAQRTSAK